MLSGSRKNAPEKQLFVARQTESRYIAHITNHESNMNDLNVINESNAKAIQRAIPDLLQAGHHVVAEYAGLHFIGAHTFRGDNPDGSALQRAQEKLAELNSSGNSTHGVLHSPEHGGGSGGVDDTSPCEVPPAGCSDNADHLAQRFGLGA